MSVLRRIKQRLGLYPPIRHKHIYLDVITGERFEITTVGRWVEIERMDAERRSDNRVRKRVMRRAITEGFVEHDENICTFCQNHNV